MTGAFRAVICNPTQFPGSARLSSSRTWKLSWCSSFPLFSMTCKPLGSRRPDISFRDRSRTADEETDDIDEQGSNSQHAEEQRLWESYSKEGVQRIASGSCKSESDAYGHQHQRVLVAALTHDKAVFPMTLERRHEHDAEDPCRTQRRQEPQRQGETTAHLPQDHQADPEPNRFEPLFLEALPQPGQTRTTEPAKELLRSVHDHCQPDHQAKNEESDVYCDSHTLCSFPHRLPGTAAVAEVFSDDCNLLDCSIISNCKNVKYSCWSGSRRLPQTDQVAYEGQPDEATRFRTEASV